MMHEINQEFLQLLIQLVPYTHVYWCPAGGHFGVIAGVTRYCPAGCNE